MSYRIVRITDLFGEFLSQYRSKFPRIPHNTYREQQEHLISESFDTASSITKYLRKLGVEAHVIFTNTEWLQKQWQIENNCAKSGKELIVEQLKSLRPDIIWFDNPTLADPLWISSVRSSVPSIRIITGLVCAPYSAKDVRTLREFDFLTTCTPCLNKEFLDNGMETYQIYHGFDSDLLEKITIENRYPTVDLLFIGSLYTGGGFHRTRIEYLENFLASGIPVKILAGVDSSSKMLTKKSVYYLVNFLRRIGLSEQIKNIPLLNHYESYGDTPIKFYSRMLKESISPSVYGVEQFKQLAKANTCFNIHGEIARGCAGNLRLFEATGVGACLVTDWKHNLSELFDLDNEVVTYKSKAECVDKLQWLLKNPSERLKIAKAGQKKTLKMHNLENRAMLINELLKTKLK